MFVGFFVGAILYGAFTLVFLIFSSAELLERRTSTLPLLTRVFFMSVFWPVSLVILASGRAFARQAKQPLRLPGVATLRLSH